MPSIDERAKAYEMGLAARFGFAVKTRRAALKLSASEVARRTSELGYPISRGAIAKIESNSRSGKVDVAELFALAAALDIPPVLLLFQGFPAGEPVEVRPGVEVSVEDAVEWVGGRRSAPRKVIRETFADTGQPIIRTAPDERFKPPNDGVKLITAELSLDKAIRDRFLLMAQLDKAQNEGGDVDTAQRMLDLHDERIEGLQNEIFEAREALWDLHSDSHTARGEFDD